MRITVAGRCPIRRFAVLPPFGCPAFRKERKKFPAVYRKSRPFPFLPPVADDSLDVRRNRPNRDAAKDGFPDVRDDDRVFRDGFAVVVPEPSSPDAVPLPHGAGSGAGFPDGCCETDDGRELRAEAGNTTTDDGKPADEDNADAASGGTRSSSGNENGKRPRSGRIPPTRAETRSRC